MTHDELLTRINGDLSISGYQFMGALTAVVELHKPVQDEPDQYTGESKPYCAGCWDAEDEYYAVRHFYPCPTIEAIEKGLE